MTDIWDWKKMVSPHWMIPAECVYYYIHEWKNYNRILDVGAGIGRHTLLFAENNYTVTAFDSSESGLKIINERAEERKLIIDTILGNMADMPFEDEAFDAILAYHSIYHASQEEFPLIVDELYRVVRSGGKVFVTLLSKEDENYITHEKEKVSRNVVLKCDGKEGPLVPHYYIDYEEIPVLFAKFDIISCQKLIEYVKGHKLIHYHLHMRK